MPRRHAYLTIDVEYDTVDVSPDNEIKKVLHDAARFLAEEGLLTNENPDLAVRNWNSLVEITG